MSFPLPLSDKHNQNCLQKCFYMMNLIKNKNPDLWEMYRPVYETLQVDESYEFYQVLIEEYQKVLNEPVKKKASKKAKKK